MLTYLILYGPQQHSKNTSHWIVCVAYYWYFPRVVPLFYLQLLLSRNNELNWRSVFFYQKKPVCLSFCLTLPIDYVLRHWKAVAWLTCFENANPLGTVMGWAGILEGNAIRFSTTLSRGNKPIPLDVQRVRLFVWNIRNRYFKDVYVLCCRYICLN